LQLSHSAIKKSRSENIRLLAAIRAGRLGETEPTIEVRQAPSTDWPVSFSVRRNEDNIEARISLDRKIRTGAVELHSPVPRETHLTDVQINGKQWTSVDRLKNVVPISGLSGDIRVLVIAK
jgi:hypothetical protein